MINGRAENLHTHTWRSWTNYLLLSSCLSCLQLTVDTLVEKYENKYQFWTFNGSACRIIHLRISLKTVWFHMKCYERICAHCNHSVAYVCNKCVHAYSKRIRGSFIIIWFVWSFNFNIFTHAYKSIFSSFIPFALFFSLLFVYFDRHNATVIALSVI